MVLLGWKYRQLDPEEISEPMVLCMHAMTTTPRLNYSDRN